MELRGKKIIVTGSARGMGAATVRAYVTAGAQVIGMDLADEVGEDVCAQATATGPGTAVYRHVDVADRERATEAQRTASYWMNRRTIALGEEYGDPDRDLGPVMVFLASDASRFITGQLIPVDGGQTSVR